LAIVVIALIGFVDYMNGGGCWVLNVGILGMMGAFCLIMFLIYITTPENEY